MVNNSFDLQNVKKVHFTGIKGVGMTALACIGKDLGWDISGSDSAEKFVTDEVLQQKGIKWDYNFDPDRINQINPHLLIFTAAHQGEKNIEVLRAKKLKVPTLSQGEALGLVSQSKKTRISIAGVGGKTTTTAILATVLENSGMQPSYMVGSGKINSLAFCGKYDLDGDIFVTEADEYPCSFDNKCPKFYYQDPNMLILPHLAFDHPDIYKGEEETLQVFSNMVTKMPDDSLIIANGDCQMINRLLKDSGKKIIYYGYLPHNNIQIKKTYFHLGKTGFDLEFNRRIQSYAINIVGQMNVANATAAIIAAKYLHLSDYQIIIGLKKYKGVARRLQIINKYKTSMLMDDYAHHPDEIKVTLKTLKEIYTNKRIVVIFQPHTFSRTKALFAEFAQSFIDCDVALLVDIYASAREKVDKEINSEILADEINNQSHNAKYIKNYGGFLSYIKDINPKNTVFITMGAGDIFTWHSAMIQELKRYYDNWI